VKERHSRNPEVSEAAGTYLEQQPNRNGVDGADTSADLPARSADRKCPLRAGPVCSPEVGLADVSVTWPLFRPGLSPSTPVNRTAPPAGQKSSRFRRRAGGRSRRRGERDSRPAHFIWTRAARCCSPSAARRMRPAAAPASRCGLRASGCKDGTRSSGCRVKGRNNVYVMLTGGTSAAISPRGAAAFPVGLPTS
jgi:hypothetical protein